MGHGRYADMYASRWMHDPFGRNQYRWFDGGWTEHVSNGGITGVDPPVAAPASAEHRPNVGHSSLPAARNRSALIEQTPATRSPSGLASMAAAGLAGLFAWLAPVVVLGGIGLLIAASATTESETYLGTTTSYDDRKMLFAMVFLALAAACFFGRGTFRSLGRVMKGQGNLVDVLFVGSNLKFGLITLAAVGAAVVALFAALASS